MNLPMLSYWDRSFAMADVVRQARFVDTSWGTNTNPDATGAPGVDFRLVFNAATIGAGTYKLIFTGKADLSLGGVPGGQVRNQAYDATSNRSTADVVLPQNVTGNTWLTFENTRRTAASTGANGVTQVHLWRPGYATDGSVIFTSEFITAMRKVQILRAMDMTSTNTNPTAHWSERTRPDFIGMTEDKGQSWELLAQLANASGRDLWINVPVKADDDFIVRLAQLFRYGSDGVNPYTSEQANPLYPPLRSDLKLYVEYGNEIWNFSGGFYGFGWAKAMSDAVRFDTSHPIARDVPGEWLALQRFIAWRSATISKTFRSVWGDGAMMSRVRPILAAQAGNANGYLSSGLIWAEGEYGDVSKIWWGGGGASYYDSTVAPSDTHAATMQGYFDGLPDADFANRIKVDTTWLKGYGLHHVSYEGGPEPGGSALGSGAAGDALSNAYNTDPRMPGRMAAAYDLWQANGGEVLLYYNYSGMGAPWWFIDGTKNLTVSDTTSPKLQFLDSLASRPVPAPTLGTAVPGTVHLRDATSALQTYMEGNTAWGYGGSAYRIQEVTNAVKNEMLLVPIRAAKAGRYSIAVTTVDTPADARVQLFVNGALAGELVPGTSTPEGTFVASSQLQVSLSEGISVVRVRAKTGLDIWVRDLVVQ
ncbi:MAG: hypothetical protein BGO13_10625 [Burkholderiales bacterium 66-5]|nr:MAG: hypothetical protein BGO13_10625 [Burkholderiales bacterium 66-5]